MTTEEHIEYTTYKDLEELINNLYKRYPEVSFAKLSKIAVRVSNWQKKQDQKSMEIMDEVYLKSCDKIRKHMIDKTCEFLKSYRRETRDGMGYVAGIIDDDTIEDFKKLMKD